MDLGWIEDGLRTSGFLGVRWIEMDFEDGSSRFFCHTIYGDFGWISGSFG